MQPTLYIIFAIIIGMAIGMSLTYIFKLLPEKWLQDYGFDPKAPNYRKSKRMKIWPHGVLAGVFCSAFYVAIILFYPDLLSKNCVLHLISFALIVPVLFLVLISDRLNRIIPDQFWVLILIFGILLLISDYTEYTIWFSEEAKWYVSIVNRIGGAIVGGGVLWLIGFVAETFTGREAMGQGDMKLLVGCGMATGLYGLVVLIYVAVIIGVLFAIPLLIKKSIRQKKEEEEIRNSPNPAAARRELQIKKSKIHFADDPDYLAFGPFLALGAGVFLSMEPVFFKMLYETLVTFGLLF